MKIDGRTKVCALLGDPVEHTLSPLIHNTFSEIEGVDSVYTAFRLKKGNVKEALDGAFALGIQGFNVTVPHKEAVLPYLSGIDPMAEKIGAVNTLVRSENGYRGYNTDASGIMREIKELSVDLDGRKVIMLGAGGAANAVLHALYSLGISGAYILNRSAEKAKEKFGEDRRNTILSMDQYGEIEGDGYFCVQCTSVGLHPDTDRAPIEDPEFYKKIGTAVDIIYNPGETRFMKLIRENGGRVENGLKMLLYQAAESFKLFHGVNLSDAGIEAAAEKLKAFLEGKSL
ncbi:MAG: shikimate dehydrogenase [Lachnospiraceae bacterium]|nr:shikimate dehydrogenase [Lachnospiraceae bacterium]